MASLAILTGITQRSRKFKKPGKDKTATIAKKSEMARMTRRTKLARVSKMARVARMA